jgi:hypothetical protein
MAALDMVVKAWDTAHWEMGEAFKGLPEADVWKRPHPRLLSVGELAAHVAYWEAQSFFGEGFETSLTAGGRYYTANVDEPFGLSMGAEEVYAEVKRVHDAAKASFLANPTRLRGAEREPGRLVLGLNGRIPGISSGVSHGSDVFGAPSSWARDGG